MSKLKFAGDVKDPARDTAKDAQSGNVKQKIVLRGRLSGRGRFLFLYSAACLAACRHLNAVYYRSWHGGRVPKLLLRAETMHDRDVCLKLREIAVGYERLARRVENDSPATQ